MIGGNKINYAILKSLPQHLIVVDTANRRVHLNQGSQFFIVARIQQQMLRRHFCGHPGGLVLTQQFGFFCGG